MSDAMLFGVLRMPYEMAMSGEISRRQFYGRAQEAADRIESLEAEVKKLRAELAAGAAREGGNTSQSAHGCHWPKCPHGEECAHARSSTAPAVGTEKDAERWRAFINSARIRPLGSAGLNKPEANNYAHMGLEIWTTFERDYSEKLLEELDRDNARGREWLIKFADVAIEAQRAAIATHVKAKEPQ